MCISLLILALAISLPVIAVKSYWHFHGSPKSFTVGVSDFLMVNESGKLSRCKRGAELQQFILNCIREINNRENNTFARIIEPQFIEISLTDFEISRHSLLSLADYLNDNFADKRANIIFGGVVSESGEIGKLNVSYTKEFFYEEGMLKLKTSDYFKKFEELIVRLCSNRTQLDKAQIMANLFYAIISQSTTIAAASHYKDVSVGLKLIDESQQIWNKAINRYVNPSESSDVKNLAMHFDIGYELNRASLFKNASRVNEEIEAIYRILVINPFFPFSSYVDFKKQYDIYYTSYVASKSLEFMKNDKTTSEEEKKQLFFRDKLYKYAGPDFLIEYFTELIVLSDNYSSNLEYYKKLSIHHPREPLIYLFWGDAIKLYKSKAFNLNLSQVDAAIEKYRIAENMDPEWPLIGSKIYIVSLLQSFQERELGHFKKADQIDALLGTYIKKLKKYGQTLEVKKFQNK